MTADIQRDLTQKTTDELKRSCESVALQEKANTAELIAHLAEIGERKAHLDWGYRNLFEYCVRGLNLGKGTVWSRLQVAGVCRRAPKALEALANGTHSLTVLGVLSRHLTEDNQDWLIAASAHKTKDEVRELLARWFPAKEVQPSIRTSAAREAEAAKMAEGEAKPSASEGQAPAPSPRDAKTGDDSSPAVQERQALNLCEPGTDEDRERSRPAQTTASRNSAPRRTTEVAPATATRFNIKFSASDEFKAKLDRLAEVMGYEAAAKHLETILEEALDIALDKKDPQRKEARRQKRQRKRPADASGHRRDAAAQAPPASRAAPTGTSGEIVRPHSHTPGKPPSERSRHIPATQRSMALARAGYQCEHRGDGGRRCSARCHLHIDHVIPFARGGSHDAANLQVLCSAHNKRKAEKDFGESFIKEKALRSRRSRMHPKPRPDEVGPG